MLAAARGAVEIGDREAAIRSAFGGLGAGDTLLVAGKGHETYQIVGDRMLPFDDAEVLRDAARVAGGDRRMSALWTAEAVAAATGGAIAGDWVACGVSIDSRTLAPGDLFVALAGPNRDGHAFVGRGARARARRPRWSSRVPEGVGRRRRPRRGRRHAGGARGPRPGRPRAGRPARIAGVTGSVGKTGTKEALRHVLGRAGADPRQCRQPQQSLGRAAEPGPPAARPRATACSSWA